MINMIRLVVTDHRFEPRIVAECTRCDWRTPCGKVIGLATVIGRAQAHVTSQHDGASRPADEVGLPGVTTIHPCPTHGPAGICRPTGGGCVVDGPLIEGYDYANAHAV